VSVYGTEELKQVEMVFELQMEGGWGGFRMVLGSRL
jgi:hypothetical protein